MTRDTYSAWKRACQEISKHFMLLKNRILDAFYLYVCVYVCVYWLWGRRALLGMRSQCKGAGCLGEQRANGTYYTAGLSLLLRAALNWLQCLFTSLFPLNITIIIFSLRNYIYI